MYVQRHHFHAAHGFTKAHTAAARAARHGDLAAADKWLKIAERHERLATRLFKLRQLAEEFENFRQWSITERRRHRRETLGKSLPG